MAVFHMILGWTAQALMFVLFLLFLAFLGYCLYLKYLHMKYDHIPGPPRNRYSKLALELKLAWCGFLVDANVIILAVAHVSLTPTLISVTFVFCFLSHTLCFSVHSFLLGHSPTFLKIMNSGGIVHDKFLEW